ncbi:MAG: hypothetical protein HYY30_11160 [Chloroflexi bacterium]|nr:hypothetical protein [Chloroflexota bacterium]
MAQRTHSFAGQAIGVVGGVNIVRALLAGFVGTVAITILMYAGPVMGFPRMDIATMLGTMFVSDPSAAFIPGLMMHFMIGLILALGYAFLFASWLPGRPWVRGALYGLVPFLMANAIVMPMMGLIHPMVLSGMMPAPGFFLVGMGTVMAPIGSLIGHLVYGAVVGAIYGQVAANRAQN